MIQAGSQNTDIQYKTKYTIWAHVMTQHTKLKLGDTLSHIRELG